MIIWLASYPRSGNTLLRTALKRAFQIESRSMHGDERDIGGSEALTEVVGHARGAVRKADVKALRQESELHLIKTHHCPVHYMDISDGVIYIIRDGRDAVVSYYNYLLNFAGDRQFSLRDVAVGVPGFGSWARHVREWEIAPFERKLVLRFENMIQDPPELVGQLAGVLGREPLSHDVPSFAELRGIDARFFRKGRAGSWSDELKETDERLFWLYNGGMMVKHGYTDRMPAGVEELVGDEWLNRYFEEQVYKSRSELETYRRNLRVHLSEAANAAAAHRAEVKKVLERAAAAASAPAAAPVPAAPQVSKNGTQRRQPDTAVARASLNGSRRLVGSESTEASDIRWFVGQVIRQAIESKDVRLLFEVARGAGKRLLRRRRKAGNDLDWVANAILSSRRSLKVPITPAPDFDEQKYLRQNSDVMKAIRAGQMSCGFAHYVFFGRKEKRPRPIV